MTILQQNNISIVTKKDDKVEKQFLTNFFHQPNYDKWLDAYNAFYNEYKCVPKIFEANENRIIMEYIEGERLDIFLHNNRKDSKKILNASKKIFELIQHFFEFSINYNIVVIHSDFNTRNFIVKKDNTLCLIDPDALLIDPVEFSGYGSIIHELSKLYNRSLLMKYDII